MITIRGYTEAVQKWKVNFDKPFSICIVKTILLYKHKPSGASYAKHGISREIMRSIQWLLAAPNTAWHTFVEGTYAHERWEGWIKMRRSLMLKRAQIMDVEKSYSQRIPFQSSEDNVTSMENFPLLPLPQLHYQPLLDEVHPPFVYILSTHVKPER